jgi:hypothetical protein
LSVTIALFPSTCVCCERKTTFSMRVAGIDSCLLLATLAGASAHPRPIQTLHVGTTVGAAVNTSSGLITGHGARNRTSVSEYLGIPYAQPPVGQLRFAAPQKFSSNTPLIASSYVSTQCPPQCFDESPLTLRAVTVRFNSSPQCPFPSSISS